MPITLSPNLQGQDRARTPGQRADKRVACRRRRHLRLDRGPDEPLHAGHGGLRHPPPAGEAYFPVEGANGELGFYVVSDGGDRPYRVRCRPPCLPPWPRCHRMIEGEMLADLIPTFGSVNMIGGEVEQ